MAGAFKKPYAYAGLALVGVVGWAMATAGGAIVSGHPSYWAAYVGSAVLGIAAVAIAVVWRSRRSRLWSAGLGTVGLVVVAGLAWWLTPFEATGRALRGLVSDDKVIVTSTPRQITMRPTATDSGIGVIFQPGARIDARAYAHILRSVAESGHFVVIVKQPLGVAFLASGFASGWVADHPDNAWVVAGHSLGGVVAARNAASSDAIGDLILWASYPASDLSTEPVNALSVYGTNDALTTSEDIAGSIDNLPDGTSFVAIPGAIHSYFGDYGLQAGDGDPETSREQAQSQIVEATLAYLEQLVERLK